jgi:tRNA(fMet)-specific endonuclease VapC
VKYLLDTDHISILQRRTGPEFAMLMTRITQNSRKDITFSIISMHEQVMGCHTYIARARTSSAQVKGYEMLARVLQNFAIAPMLLFDPEAALVLDRLVAQRIRIGKMDLRLASIALSRGLILVTRNTSDFSKVPELRIEDWTISN